MRVILTNERPIASVTDLVSPLRNRSPSTNV